MANKSKQDERKLLNDYENLRILTVKANKKKLRDLGNKNVSNSLTSLVASKKTKKTLVKQASTNANDMEYIPDMDDDSENELQQAATIPKKQHRPKYIAPMSMNKFANSAKQHRVIAPKVSQKFPSDSNPSKLNQSTRTVDMAELISSHKESQKPREVLIKNMTSPTYINVGAKRQLVLPDEDDHDEIFHEGNAMPFQEAEQEEQSQSADADSDNDEEIGNAITRKKRGITYGKGARKIMTKSKKRLPLEFDFKTRRVISENDSAFMYECGYIVRNNCSFQFKDWRHVPNEVRLPLRHRLTTLFDIDVENSNICKVIDSYMARAWRIHRAKLHDHFKEIGGLKDPAKIKASPPYKTNKEDWEYLCDMWCDTKFLEIAKKRSDACKNRKIHSRNGSKSTIRYHIELGHALNSSTGQIETWRKTHWNEENGWISKDAAAIYEDMMKLRSQHSVESMSDKSILEKVLGRSSVRLHGWGRDPTISSNAMGDNQTSKKRSQKELEDELEAVKGTLAMVQEKLIEKNLISPLRNTTGPSQDDISDCEENTE